MIITYVFISITVLLTLSLAYTLFLIAKLMKRLKLEQQYKIIEKGTID